jgi:hypothetical protein
MKKRSSVIFCEYIARSKKSREAALLCYRGLGAAIKMSAILFDDKNLELLGCLPSHAIWQCLRSQDKQPSKNCTAISARNLAASILHQNAPRSRLRLEGFTRISTIVR